MFEFIVPSLELATPSFTVVIDVWMLVAVYFVLGVLLARCMWVYLNKHDWPDDLAKLFTVLTIFAWPIVCACWFIFREKTK